MKRIGRRIATVVALALGAGPARAVGQIVNFGPMDGEQYPSCVVSRGADKSFYLVDLKHEKIQKVGPKGRLSHASAEEAFSTGEIVSGDPSFVVTSDGQGGIFFAGACLAVGVVGNAACAISHWKDTGHIDAGDREDSFSTAALAHGSAGVFAVGQGRGDHDDKVRWQVRRWDEGKKGWAIVDQLSGSDRDQPTAVHVAPDGIVFAAGVVEKNWIVRRSVDQGRTWKQVDTFQLVEDGLSVPGDIAADSRGNVHVVGYAEVEHVPPESVDLADDSHWIVRSSRDGGEHFQTTENLTSPRKKGESRADAVTILPNGDVAVIGTVGYPDRRQIRVLRPNAKRWISVGSRPLVRPGHRHGVLGTETSSLFSLGENIGRENECWLERHRVPR